MEKISSLGWQYRGSSVLFDQTYLKEFAFSQVSLRQALSWYGNFPDAPPFPSKTILLMGVETIAETIPPASAEDFLTSHVQPLLRRIQNRWTDVAVILGFTNPAGAFDLTVKDESMLFRRGDTKTVNLSNSLWDGSAPQNMRQITVEEQGTGKEVVIGYHVSRIS